MIHRCTPFVVALLCGLTLHSSRVVAEDAPAGEPRARPSRIVDTHIHLYDTRRREGVPWPPKDDEVLYGPHLPADFERVARPAGVTGVVIVEASDRLADNRWVLDLVKGNDFFVGLVGNVDPYREDFAEHVDRLRRDRRFVGIRARVQGRRIDYRNERVLESFAHLAERELTLDILMNGEKADVVREIDRVARRLPKLTIVVNHVLGYDIDGKPPGDDWVAAVERLAANENVYCKVSGLYQRSVPQPAPRDLDHYRSLLDVLWKHFGSERLVYGSNWPVTKKSGDYASYVRIVDEYFAAKGEEARERYFWRNAVRAYRLPTGDED